MTKDLNPQQYKQMMNYLTRPKQKPRAGEKEKQKSDFMSLIKQILNMS